eukprot:8110125-Pyramimonas_sp.AAC.1
MVYEGSRAPGTLRRIAPATELGRGSRIGCMWAIESILPNSWVGATDLSAPVKLRNTLTKGSIYLGK